jgi:hypothetical protein
VVLDAISDATNCRFASSHRTVVPASPLTCNTGGERIEEEVRRALLTREVAGNERRRGAASAISDDRARLRAVLVSIAAAEDLLD